MTRYVSLFSGAMGLDLGLEKAGFEASVCVEIDPEAVATIRFNRPSLPVVNRSITDVSGQELMETGGFSGQEVSLVAGGPPCQAFSNFGNRLGIADARGQMLFEFLRIIEEVRPRTFLMENVRGLLSMSVVPRNRREQAGPDCPEEYFENGSLLDLLFREFNQIGYNVNCFVVNAVNYGAPQIRERLLIFGNRFGLDVHFPAPRFSNRPADGLPPFKTLGEAIGPDTGFADACPETLDFSPRKLKYLAQVPPGGNWRSLPLDVQKEAMGKSWHLTGGRSGFWRKLSYNFPSPTVVTMPNHAGTSMCHPEALRAITVGEAAALQEFPPDWVFRGSTASKFRQVGNAVPLKLGEVAGGVLSDLLKKIEPMHQPSAPQCTSSVEHIRPHVRTRVFWKNGRPFAGDADYYGE